MTQYAGMWNGHLERTSVFMHQIILTPCDSLPIKSAPFRASRQKRALKTGKVDKMLKEGVAVRTMFEWASAVASAHRTDGDESRSFRVKYRRLDATTVRINYFVAQTDEYIDLLGHAKMFPTLDDN